ncbi:MAG: hypothetical protein E7042_05675 [Lentisphaerae bacterium]|nr:hypothetical protein [Lentisphaerota bacterium]
MIYIIEKLQLNALKLPRNYAALLPSFIGRELHIDPRQISHCEIISSSIDSRRGTPKLVLKLLFETGQKLSRFAPASPEEIAALAVPDPELPDTTTLRHPIVVGTGPAGISAAYLLAAAGCAPVIIDRGFPVEKRAADYRKFLDSRRLDSESNLLIGEGGAGTFSDGKLHTGTKDRRGRFLKKLWVECGAPEEILYLSRPHIGSDKLLGLCAGLRKKIEVMGGTFRFGTEVVDLLIKNGSCRGVILASGEVIEAPAVLFAPGLGGRELLRRVCRSAAWELKPFQTGCRVEHPQTIIDRAMYHLPSRPDALGAAEYHIVSRAEVGNVSSFCMCPGGRVVNASAWEGRSITNGMSCFARADEFANSCLITTIDPEDFGNDAGRVFEFFAGVERSIFSAGGRDYTFPAQDAGAFLAGKSGLNNSANGCDTGIVPGRLDQLLPEQLKNALIPAVKNFEHKIPGFIKYGKFIGAESFVSSPVRLLRDFETMENPELPGLYPAGEGCGLAGGIVSAACDGMRAAEAMLKISGI